MGPFLYHPLPSSSRFHIAHGVGGDFQARSDPKWGIVERVSTLSGPKTHPGEHVRCFILHTGGGPPPTSSDSTRSRRLLSAIQHFISHTGLVRSIDFARGYEFSSVHPSSNPLYRLYSANLIPYTVSIFIYSFDLTAQTWLTATIKNLSQSIKGRLQEGVQNSVFQDKGLLDPDAVIDEDRIVGRDDQLDDIITYLRPALQGNRPPNMLLYGPSGTGKSLIINAVCQQVLELANSQEIGSVLSKSTARRSNRTTALSIAWRRMRLTKPVSMSAFLKVVSRRTRSSIGSTKF